MKPNFVHRDSMAAGMDASDPKALLKKKFIQEHHNEVPAESKDHTLRYVRPEVLSMKAYVPGEQTAGCVKMNTNEMAFPPSPAVREALSSYLDDALRLYPNPVSQDLREAAGKAYNVTPDQIMVGNGSDDCLTIIMRSFMRPGDTVTTPWPSYGLYDTLASIQGVKINHVDWDSSPQAAGTPGWGLPSQAITHSGSRVCFLANPNNPSATLVPIEELKKLAHSFQGILVVDEAYMDFACEGAALDESFIPHLNDFPNTIVIRTFSKSYSLAGARLGLLFANEKLVVELHKVKDSYNVNSLTQIAGLAAVQDTAYFQEIISKTLAERKVLENGLAKLELTFPPSAANFLLVEMGTPEKAALVYEGLKEKGLLVRYWGNRPDLHTKLRITVGRPEHNQQLLQLMEELVTKS